MKKNIGSLLALYPLPVTVIGAMNGANPTWTLVAHVGIIGHDMTRFWSVWQNHTLSTVLSRKPKS
uniref:hypothetical protein n=1 Tax=Enterocloster clostridioformis TaxID=1531 RepID=UPI000A511E70|nr:hypothetical protein [Enterocloster clostridioformis]